MTDPNPYGPQPGPPPQANPWANDVTVTNLRPPSRYSGLGIAATILACFAFLVAWIPFFIGLFLSFVPVLLAIVFGIVDVSTAGRRGRSMLFGLIGLVTGGVIFLGWFAGLGTLW